MADSEDVQIPSVTMGQAMSVLAGVFAAYINAFVAPSDTEEEKTTLSYVAIAIFLHQFCAPAKHKDKMIGVLKVIIADLEEANAQPV